MGTAQRYDTFARVEAHGNSPSYEALALGIAGDQRLCDRLDGLPAPKRQPNLLFGAVRYLDGPVHSFSVFRRWLDVHWDEVGATMLARRTQTNEPGRQACLLPLLAALNGPLALLEVGASAGLCLYPDRWSYDFGGVAVGDPEFPLLTCDVTGDPPIPTAVPDICWRAGLDLNPLSVTDADDMRWLECLVWPEQHERRERLSSAIAIARANPPLLVEGDLVTDLAALAARAPQNATLVVFHSAVLVYVPAELRVRFVEAVLALPGHWISNEGPGAVPGVLTPPLAGDAPARFVLALDGDPVALTAPHGQNLDWLA